LGLLIAKRQAPRLLARGHAIELLDSLIYPCHIRKTSIRIANIVKSHGLWGGQAMARRPSALIPGQGVSETPYTEVDFAFLVDCLYISLQN
jgi:hypothetical protein